MASKQMLLAILSIVAVTVPEIARATEYVVGDGVGWTINFNYITWADGKDFRVGDTLVFKYPVGYDNVYPVGGPEFKVCKLSPGSQTLALTSGNDVVTLSTPGRKWYISGIADGQNCQAGQRLVITVRPQWQASAPSPFASGWKAPASSPWMSVWTAHAPSPSMSTWKQDSDSSSTEVVEWRAPASTPLIPTWTTHASSPSISAWQQDSDSHSTEAAEGQTPASSHWMPTWTTHAPSPSMSTWQQDSDSSSTEAAEWRAPAPSPSAGSVRDW